MAATERPDPPAGSPRLICRGCAAPSTRRVADLGSQPASDDFPPASQPGPDQRWPLELWWCPVCSLVQLGPVEALLEEPVRAVESQTSRRHAESVVQAVLRDHPELSGCRVREFASHHGGSWLEALGRHGCRPVPVGERADMVVDAHALAHEPDVRRALADRVHALDESGLLVLEFHHLLPLVLETQFDTVRHGHWCYLSLTAVDRLAALHDLEVVQAVPEAVFGGSLRVLLARSGRRPVDPGVAALLASEREAGLADGTGVQRFGRQAKTSAQALFDYLSEQRSVGRSVLAYGAPSKAAVLLGVSGVGTDLIGFTVDASAAKHGLVVPGIRLPIRPVAELVAARPDVVVILTWDIADEVVAQLEAAGGWGAEYVLPLPTPHRFSPPLAVGAVR